MDPQLTIGRKGVDVRRVQLTGRPGLGTHQVNLSLELTPNKPAKFRSAVLVMTGELEIQIGQGAPRPVGPLLPAFTVQFPWHEDGRVKAPMHASVNIPPDQLDAIERERDGGDLALSLKLQGVLFRPDDHEPTPEEPMRHGFTDDLLFRVKAAEWVEVLQQLQYAEGFLVQVPKFASRDTPKALSAAAELTKAVKELSEGRYEEAVGLCRNALEIAYGAEVTQPPVALGYVAPTNERQVGKEERFWLVRRGLWAVTNAAKHKDPVGQAITWERSDAASAITIVASLLQQDPPV